MGKKKQPNGAGNGTENARAQFTLDQKRKFGPVKKRSCTDILCLILFVAFLAVWGYVLVFFYKYVDIERTLNPSDIYGNVCGKGKYKDKPYLAFFNIFTCAVKIESSIINGCETPQVCVSHCPNITFSINKASGQLVRVQEAQHAICLYDVQPTAQNIWQLTEEGKCAKFYLNSDPVGGRCLPSVLKMVPRTSDILNELTNKSLIGVNGANVSAQEVLQNNEVMATLMKAIALGTKIANDIAITWQWILIGLVAAMILAFFWIFLMQWLARYMIWLSIVAIFVVNGLGLYYSFTEYQRLSSHTSSNSTLDQENGSLSVKSSFMASLGVDMSEMPVESGKTLKYIRAESDGLSFDLDLSGKLKDELNSYRNNPKTWMVLSIVLAVILVIITSLLFCLCRRISLAIAVIEEASKAVNCMKSTLFFPIVPYILKVVVLALWMGAVVIIASGSHPQYRFPNDTLCVPEQLSPEHQQHIFGKSGVTPSTHLNDTDCTFKRPFTTNLVYGAHALNLFGVIWVLFFLMGVCYITLSGAFASYYWTIHKEEVPFFALLGSFLLCVRYHLGSVAFGSLLVAIVRFIRVILEYIDSKCKKYADNIVVKAIVCCLKCCFWCLENFIKFINKNAFIMIAIYGKNFCASAKDAFSLLLNNGIRAVVLNCLSDFLLFLSKLAVTGLVGVAGFFVLTNRADFLVHFDGLNYYWAPLTLFVILSYIVTSTFFNVYDVAIETIFMCYLEDCKENDGSRERPYYMAKNLAKVFNTRNRKYSE